MVATYWRKLEELAPFNEKHLKAVEAHKRKLRAKAAKRAKKREAEELKRKPTKSTHENKLTKEDRLRQFYRSPEWKRLRYDILDLRGSVCECCGATRHHGARIVVDHIKPIRKYWDLRLMKDNLQVLCDDCNIGKGSRNQRDWRQSHSRLNTKLPS